MNNVRYAIKNRGFTIVELLIVIVVIGILAAITIVAFNGIQQRAKDTGRKSDVSSLAKALSMYQADHGLMGAGSGCGSNGNGEGWLNGDYDNTGPLKSINQCLIDGGYLKQTLSDPGESLSCIVLSTSPTRYDCSRYMKYNCAAENASYVYANLDTMPHSLTDTDSSCHPTLDGSYGMNYFLKAN